MASIHAKVERRQIQKVQQEEPVDSQISGLPLLVAVKKAVLLGKQPPTFAGLVTAGCGPSDLFWYRLSAATKAPSWNQPMYNDIVSALGKFVLQATWTAEGIREHVEARI